MADKDLMLLPVDENRNLEKVMSDVATAKDAMDKIKKAYTELQDLLKKFMAEKGFKKLETETVAVTYKEPGTRESFDIKRFKTDYPDLYDEYAMIAETADSLLIKFKKADEVA